MPGPLWEVRWSNSRNLPYFFNTQENRSEWTPPLGLSDAQVRLLPGAAQYLTPFDPAKHSVTGQAGANIPRDPEPRVRKARASHILAKHVKSRRPSSWREATITRTPQQAREIIQGHIDRLNALPADQRAGAFAAIAKTESDCSSAKQGGDLGLFKEGQMQASFEEATFALEPGQLSGIVETDSGTHVIMRFA